jgi:hypothetical protein
MRDIPTLRALGRNEKSRPTVNRVDVALRLVVLPVETRPYASGYPVKFVPKFGQAWFGG